MIRIALLPGDGVGPEVLDGPTRALRDLAIATSTIEVTGPWPVGASAFGECGDALPGDTLKACEAADAVLLGAVGEHPGVSLDSFRPELALLALREHFDLRVSVRQVWRGDAPPLTIVRNLLGGAYGPERHRGESDGESEASDRVVLEPRQIAELAGIACDLIAHEPSLSLVSVDKANLFATSRLWRRVVAQVAAERGIPVRHMYVDRCAFELAHDPLPDAVILTEGIFGDILSDLAAGRAGSIALCSSASVHPGEPAAGRCVGLFEPVHGSAPRHAGARRANPTGAYLALAATLDWFPETAEFAPAIRSAVAAALRSGPRTYDLAGPGEPVAGTDEFAGRINEQLGAVVA